MKSICAIVVLYNPDRSMFNNIETYIDDVDKIFLLDNSDNNRFNIDNDKIEYISFKENKGLAFALKFGCEKAINDGYEYVLTMDQDSYFDKYSFSKLVDFIMKNSEFAIVSPNVRSLYYDQKENMEKEAFIQYPQNKNTIVNWSMTSGSLINLMYYQNIKGFDDQMFIAHVDIDLCFQFSLINKKIIIIGDSILNQHFGNSKPKKILWKVVHPSFASPIRTYYLFRNQKYLENKYKKYNIKSFINIKLSKFIIKITLFENNKIEKYYMMIKGIVDGKRNKMGKYS